MNILRKQESNIESKETSEELSKNIPFSSDDLRWFYLWKKKPWNTDGIWVCVTEKEEKKRQETEFSSVSSPHSVVEWLFNMDLAVAWYQEEQEGEAKRIWSNIWETTEMDFQQQQLLQQQQQQQQANNGNNSDTKSNDSNTSNNNFPVEKTFNPTRRKGSTNDNKASTYNMNKYQGKLVGKHGGCPWRPHNFQYARGIVG